MSCKTYDPCLDVKLNQIGSYASVARQSAQSATTSATQSANSATSAAASAAAAAASAEIAGIYLGPFAVAPTTDNDGGPLQEGMLYYNTVSNGLFVWNGTVWVSADFNQFTNFTATGTTFARDLVTRMADVLNVKDFGAVGDGIADDTAAIQAALTAAASSGKKCVAPTGTYLISNILNISITKSFEIECQVDTIFKVTTGFPANTALFRFQASNTIGNKKFIWKNGTIDGRLIPVKTITSSPDLLAVFGAINSADNILDTLVDNVSFLLNDTWPATAGDSCLYLERGQNYSITNCFFRGATDAAIYMSGDPSETLGRKVVVTGNTFELCQVGYISKRQFEDQIISNNFCVECVNGIIVGGEADSTLLPGKKAVISSNILKKVFQPIAARVADETIIANNRIEDPGVGPDLIPALGRAIRIQGSSGCVVIGNSIGMQNFTSVALNAGIQIVSFTFNSITYNSNNNLITGNSIYEMPRGVFEETGAGQNNIISANNKYVNCAEPTRVSGFLSISGDHIVGTLPQILFDSPNGALNQKYWRIIAQETQLAISARNDDNTNAGSLIGAIRSGGILRQLFTSISAVPEYADDVAAQAGGVPVGGFYRTASVVKIRVA